MIGAARVAVRRAANAGRVGQKPQSSSIHRRLHVTALGSHRMRPHKNMGVRSMSAVTQNVPEMGDSITEGTIAGWSKAVGEYVEVDEVSHQPIPKT